MLGRLRSKSQRGGTAPIRDPRRTASRLASNATEFSGNQLIRCDRGTDSFELFVRVGTDGTDGSQANDYDQSKHHCVLNSGRAVFFLQKIYDAISEILHVSLLASEMHTGHGMRRRLEIWLKVNQTRTGAASFPTFA